MLKVRVLMDNNALIDNYYTAEAGFCLFLEAGGRRILFDTGYSGLFIRNAELTGIDLTALDAVAISHGHNDHTWGLGHLIQYYDRRFTANRPRLVLHPEALVRKRLKQQEIGMTVDRDVLAQFFRLEPGRSPVELAEKLTWLSEIPRTVEPARPLGQKCSCGGAADDFLEDDSALVYDGEEGLVILTGCSHAGICNIVDYAMKVTGKHRIRDIVGGFHMLREREDVLEETGRRLAALAPQTTHPCHCTDLKAKMTLSRFIPLEETGVGMELIYR